MVIQSSDIKTPEISLHFSQITSISNQLYFIIISNHIFKSIYIFSVTYRTYISCSVTSPFSVQSAIGFNRGRDLMVHTIAVCCNISSGPGGCTTIDLLIEQNPLQY